VLDCLTDLKKRFQGFVDGQHTFETLKHAVNKEVVNCNDTIVRDFVTNAHREGLLSNAHFKALLEEISTTTGQQANLKPGQGANPDVSENLPEELTVLNDRFVLGPVIGKGGMGVVYRARDLRKMEAGDSDDVVAIKVISSNLRAHPESIIALQREAKKAQKLAHPNIVNVYDFDRDGDIAYMTMEYLDGVPLSKIIKAHAPLPHKEAIRIIKNIARGLSYAHKHNIVHSDLKPGNIFVLKSGAIKILDFGIARAFKVHDERTVSLTITNNQIFNAFTPAYASCEMIDSMEPTPKDDIYALGCVAHELLTRKHPYSRMSADKAKEEKLVVKKDSNLTVSEYRAILHAIELDKDKRVNSVNSFLRALIKSKPQSKPIYLSAKALVVVFVLFSLIIGIYSVNKIKTYEMIATQKTNIINKFEIENALEKAEDYLGVYKITKVQNNDALILYQQVLKLDADNQQARTGLERLKEIYINDTKDAIESNELERASSLLRTLEKSFESTTELQHLKDKLNQSKIASQIDQLIDRATKEEMQRHYVRPVDNCAYDIYLQVLELAPKEPRALTGLKRIRKLILAETEILIDNNELERAKERIKDALLISPGSSDALALYKEIVTKRLLGKNQGVEDGMVPALSNNVIEQKPEVGRLSVSQERLIKIHTKQAANYVKQNILHGTNNNNAAYHFEKILSLDAENEYAKEGLEKAWKSLINSIEHDVELKQFENAIKTLEASGHHFSIVYDTKSVFSDVMEKQHNYQFEKQQKHDLETHLAQARWYAEKNSWTLPRGSNAMESYLEVLKIDPNNEEAMSGLKKAEKLLSSRVRSIIKKEQYSRADKVLSHALLIFPDSQELNSLKPVLGEARRNYMQQLEEDEEKKKIDDLLSDAKLAFSKKHYIYPVGRSAYDYYTEIAQIDSESKVAIRGINQALFGVYDQIKLDIDNKNYYMARLKLKRLEDLDVDDIPISELREKIAGLDKNQGIATIQQNSGDNYTVTLLRFAKQQKEKGVIWPPASNNAYSIYRHVMDVQPYNGVSRKALANLFDGRLKSINDLMQNKRWNEAERELMLLGGLYVNKSKEEVLSQKLNELSQLKAIDLQASALENLTSY
jgi:serine/threonine protein kinase